MKHLFDAKNRIVGRLAVEIAISLRGKDRPDFLPYKESGEEVEVINAKDMKLSGKKGFQKLYWRYTGYPGGIKKTTYEELMKKSPAEVLRFAVARMLPKNKLRAKWMNRLIIK
ncbi:MAG: 50S ribosomal protein L13 [Candidatus Spechtbacteria bacterium]|nr:50S ribosomal protein L13 [Candidatus Spechtbacteria bacterium]